MARHSKAQLARIAADADKYAAVSEQRADFLESEGKSNAADIQRRHADEWRETAAAARQGNDAYSALEG